MAYAQKINGTWVELPVGPSVRYLDFAASYDTVLLWSNAEREAFGVYEISDIPPVQSGKTAVAGPIIDVNGKPVRSYTLVDTPTPTGPPYYIPPSLLRQRAQKLGIWEDLTDYLMQFPSLMLMVLTLEDGIDPHYPELINGFNSLNIPQSIQDYLLGDPALGV